MLKVNLQRLILNKGIELVPDKLVFKIQDFQWQTSVKRDETEDPLKITWDQGEASVVYPVKDSFTNMLIQLKGEPDSLTATFGMTLDELCKTGGTYLTKELTFNCRPIGKLTFTSEFETLTLEDLELKASNQNSEIDNAEEKLLFEAEIPKEDAEAELPAQAAAKIVVELNSGASSIPEVEEREVEEREVSWREKIR